VKSELTWDAAFRRLESDALDCVSSPEARRAAHAWMLEIRHSCCARPPKAVEGTDTHGVVVRWERTRMHFDAAGRHCWEM